GERLQHVERIVTRAVIDKNEFEAIRRVFVGERLEFAQEIGQAGRVVVNRHDNRYQCHRFSVPSLFRPKYASSRCRCSSSTLRTSRAGMPATTVQAATSCVTTAPGATSAPMPISIPAARIALVPIRAKRRTTGPRTEKDSSPKRFKYTSLSFTLLTPGPMNTSGSTSILPVRIAPSITRVRSPTWVSYM